MLQQAGAALGAGIGDIGAVGEHGSSRRIVHSQLGGGGQDISLAVLVLGLKGTIKIRKLDRQ